MVNKTAVRSAPGPHRPPLYLYIGQHLKHKAKQGSEDGDRYQIIYNKKDKRRNARKLLFQPAIDRR